MAEFILFVWVLFFSYNDIMPNSPNLGFTYISVLFIYFSCCFSQDYSYDNKLNNPVENQSIVFRVINGKEAKRGDIPYQVS